MFCVQGDGGSHDVITQQRFTIISLLPLLNISGAIETAYIQTKYSSQNMRQG